jgi:hypothetical protein
VDGAKIYAEVCVCVCVGGSMGVGGSGASFGGAGSGKGNVDGAKMYAEVWAWGWGRGKAQQGAAGAAAPAAPRRHWHGCAVTAAGSPPTAPSHPDNLAPPLPLLHPHQERHPQEARAAQLPQAGVAPRRRRQPPRHAGGRGRGGFERAPAVAERGGGWEGCGCRRRARGGVLAVPPTQPLRPSPIQNPGQDADGDQEHGGDHQEPGEGAGGEQPGEDSGWGWRGGVSGCAGGGLGWAGGAGCTGAWLSPPLPLPPPPPPRSPSLPNPFPPCAPVQPRCSSSSSSLRTWICRPRCVEAGTGGPGAPTDCGAAPKGVGAASGPTSRWRAHAAAGRLPDSSSPPPPPHPNPPRWSRTS